MLIKLNKIYQNNFSSYKTKANKIAKLQISYWNLLKDYSNKNFNYFNKVKNEFNIYDLNSKFNKNEKFIIENITNIFIELNNDKLYLPEIKKIQRTELNIEKRKEVDILLNKKLESINENFKNLIIDRNIYAQKLGYKNFYEYKIKNKNENYNEIENIINKIRESDIYKENIKKNNEIISKKFNIPIKDLKDYHRSFDVLSLLNLNKYIKEKNFFDITKDFYKNIGFDIDKYVENKNIIYDLYPRKNKYNGSITIPVSKKQLRVITNINNDINNLSALIHEFGHSIHYLNVSKFLPYKYFPKNLVSENVAILLESLLYKENFLLKYLPKDILEITKNYYKISETNKIAKFMSMIEFEKQIYENPNKDFCKLWNEIKSKNYFINKTDEKDYSYITNLIIQKPLQYNNYLKSFLIKEQIYEKLKNEIGCNLTETTKTSDILRKKIFRYGYFFNIDNFIKEKINPEYFLNSIKLNKK